MSKGIDLPCPTAFLSLVPPMSLDRSPADDSQTRLSLIERLQNKDDDAWAYFETFYGPIIFRFALSRGLNHDQAEEIRSACYEALVKQIHELQYDRKRGRFRNWLLTIAARRISDLGRKRVGLQADTRILEAIETPDSDIEQVWESQWRQQLLLEAYRRVESRMSDSSRAIFKRIVQESCPAPQIAVELGVSENQIYKTKQRSLRMLREEIQILESDPLTSD